MKDYAKIFVEGTSVLPQDFDGSEEEAEFLVENNITFNAEIADTVAAHLYQVEDCLPENSRTWFGWPVAERAGKFIRLSSCFGIGLESYVLVKNAVVATNFS